MMNVSKFAGAFIFIATIVSGFKIPCSFHGEFGSLQRNIKKAKQDLDYLSQNPAAATVPQPTAKLHPSLSSTAPQKFPSEEPLLNFKTHNVPKIKQLDSVTYGSKQHEQHGKFGEQKYFGQEKDRKHENAYFKETAKKGEDKKEDSIKTVSENSGHKKKYNSGDEFGKEHQEKGGHSHGGSHKEHEKHNGGSFSKGFHDTHHKDERKKLDSYYNNNHEEGKWMHFGKQKKKYEKEGSNKKEDKFSKEAKSKDAYEHQEKDKKGKGISHAEEFHNKGDKEDKYEHKKQFSIGKSNKDSKKMAEKS